MSTKSVQLKKAHTHAGKRHDAGSVITVNAEEANWLSDNGIGDIESAPKVEVPAQPQPEARSKKPLI